jgi:hypothetical protein
VGKCRTTQLPRLASGSLESGSSSRCNIARMGWMTDQVNMQCGDAHMKESEDQKTSSYHR